MDRVDDMERLLVVVMWSVVDRLHIDHSSYLMSAVLVLMITMGCMVRVMVVMTPRTIRSGGYRGEK